MKEFYTIGETAALLGISADTLRYYDRIGLLKPVKVDAGNKYRYYSYTQFHYIDRIKYLQHLGLSLEEIRTVLQTGRVDELLVYLETEKVRVQEELAQVRQRVEDIDWYIQYFTYMDQTDRDERFYKVHLPERYILKSPCFHWDSLADMEIRLAEKKGGSPYKQLKYKRQYGYILTPDALFARTFAPEFYFIFLSGRPQLLPGEYEVLPAGEYLCFRTQVLREEWDTEKLDSYFRKTRRPGLVLALEFEDNLREYQDAWYEIQMLVSKSSDGTLMRTR